MQVTAAPASNSHEKFFFPALTSNLGLILSPLKGFIISNILLHVVMEMVHKLRINCGMMLGVWMRGVIRIYIEDPNGHKEKRCSAPFITKPKRNNAHKRSRLTHKHIWQKKNDAQKSCQKPVKTPWK
jgi:hypothetical protein